ncbi:hypothetical protein FOCC_FOCC015600 [Frankliniella occidentalis]|nr:hypothetical protein FOCC_FOCC015600 [Frankliniella occidentalis]
MHHPRTWKNRHSSVIKNLFEAMDDDTKQQLRIERAVPGGSATRLLPDVVLLDKQKKEATIIDIACPFEKRSLALNKKREEKCLKYEPICEEVLNLLAEIQSKNLDNVTYVSVEELTDFLRPFKLFTDRVQADKRPTIQYVEPALDILCRHCSWKEDDSPGIATVRSKASGLLREKVKIKMEHKIARFLRPSQKHLKGYTDSPQKRYTTPSGSGSRRSKPGRSHLRCK